VDWLRPNAIPERPKTVQIVFLATDKEGATQMRFRNWVVSRTTKSSPMLAYTPGLGYKVFSFRGDSLAYRRKCLDVGKWEGSLQADGCANRQTMTEQLGAIWTVLCVS